MKHVRTPSPACADRLLSIAALCTLLPLAGLAVAAEDDGLGGRLRVDVAEVTRAALITRRPSTGVIRAWRTATVAAEASGRVVERVVEPGHDAAAGDTLLRIDDRALKASLDQRRAETAAREIDAEDAARDEARARRLFEQNAISEDVVEDRRFAETRARADLDAARARLTDAERQFADSRVLAPFTGTVEAVHVQPGDYVTPGTPVVTLTDFSRARLVSGVSGADADRIRVGETASLSISDLGGLRLPATVTSVGRIKREQSGTFAVELLIDTPEVDRLRDGLIAVVRWGDGDDSATTTIPVGAVVRREGRLVAFVVDDGVAQERIIETGRSDGARIAVHDGLALGERVVIRGHFALRDGTAVEIAASSAP